MPLFIEQPWAKLAYDENRNVTAALPLIEHSLDVAAAGAALLRSGAWARALAAAAGRTLTELDIARLIVLIALHDIGKVNSGFQARWNPEADRIGHEGQVAALLRDPALSKTLGSLALYELLSGWGATGYLAALMAHHGRPREEFGPAKAGEQAWEKHRLHWHPANDYDPSAEAARLIEQVRVHHPEASEAGEPLPKSPRFVALFAGLVTLADWLGSDTRRFPVEGPYCAEREAMRAERAVQTVAAEGLTPLATPPADFTTAFEFSPRGVQSEAAADDLGAVALIEAETGSGKTEAALWRWLELRRRGEVDGLFFALPTRSAAVQLQTRVEAMLRRIWGDKGPRAVLAVPGYLRAGDIEGQALPGYAVAWDDQGDDGRWAAESSKRFLAARVAVGTIDQALLGALRIRHAPFRAAALARSLLVVDEVHASDAYMGGLLERLLANHVAVGGHVLLLSATLGAEARSRLLGQKVPSLAEAVALPYPALSGGDAPLRAVTATDTSTKTVSIEIAQSIDDAAAIAARAVEAARGGASVLIVRNSVGGAIAVAQAVEALAPDLAFQVNNVATLHHGRFAPSDRRLLDAAVEREFGRKRTAHGRVLVGTQTLEQSLDIDADLLITDLAPIDVLLQRIGRLHRHPRDDRGAFAEARAIVLRPADRDLTDLLGRVRERHGLGPRTDGANGVYPDLLTLEATLRLIEAEEPVTIPADNRRLVEGALHPEIRKCLTAELGTTWMNHDATLMGKVHAERKMAEGQSVTWETPFSKLDFSIEEAIGTRLGARDLLVDFDTPLAGPFGDPIARIAIPHWLAHGVRIEDTPDPLGLHEAGETFRLGERTFVYGRWGLSPLA